METFDSMDKAALEAELLRLRDILDETIEERDMIFSTTGLHRSLAAHVKKYKEEIDELTEKIARVTTLLSRDEK